MIEALLEQAIEAIKRGEKANGQRLLAQVLRADPRSEAAWLWMSQIVDTDAQRLDCLRRILAINPDNATARRGIELLEARTKKPGGPAAGEAASRPAPAPTRLAPRSAPIQAEPPPPSSRPAPLSDVAAGQMRPAETLAPIEETPLPIVPPAPPAPVEAVIPIRVKQKQPRAPRPSPRSAPRRSRLPLLLLLLLVIAGGGALAVLATRPAAPTAPAPIAARLAVNLARAGQTDLALIQSDGSGLSVLREGVSTDSRPVWSPDGTRIAFAAPAPDAPAVMVVDANGKNAVAWARGVDPAWSPDGARIAFAAEIDGDFDIFVMQAGGGAFNLTRFEGDDRSPAWTPDGAGIVFQSDREGQFDIYRMNADGSNVKRLTSDDAEETAPAVSPDGKSVAFVSQPAPDSDADIFVMSLDGSQPRAITDNDVGEGAPAWTADGSILFTRDGRLFIAQADGSDPKPLWGTSPDGDVVGAAWQPVDADPAAIAARVVPTPTVAAPPFELPDGAVTFASNRDGDFRLYRMKLGQAASAVRGLDLEDARHPARAPAADQLALDAPISGTLRLFVVGFATVEPAVITLTQETVSAHNPTWSRDGTLIAYEIDADGGPDLALIQPDGSGAVRLTNRPGYDGCASWSLDGERLAFASDRGGNFDVYLLDAASLSIERVTAHPAADGCPSFSPDGQLIAFVSERNGEGVYLMNPDGSNAHVLAAMRRASQPAWSPDGQFIMLSSDQDGDADLYLIRVEDGAMWNLTADSNADEVDPMWEP